MCGFSSCGMQRTKIKSGEIACLVIQREKYGKESQYHMWCWWVHCLSDFNSRSGDKVLLSLSPDLLQLWAKQPFSLCFWCSSLKMNWANLNDHKMNGYYPQVKVYVASGYAIWPVPLYQPEASPQSSLWLWGQLKQDWEVEPPFLLHALSPKVRKGTCICRRQLQHFPTNPTFNELADQDRKGREITLYTGILLFSVNSKEVTKSALWSH